MNTDYPKQGVLNGNHQVSAAFTRERLRARAFALTGCPAPEPGMPASAATEERAEPGAVDAVSSEPAAALPPSA